MISTLDLGEIEERGIYPTFRSRISTMEPIGTKVPASGAAIETSGRTSTVDPGGGGGSGGSVPPPLKLRAFSNKVAHQQTGLKGGFGVRTLISAARISARRALIPAC